MAKKNENIELKKRIKELESKLESLHNQHIPFGQVIKEKFPLTSENIFQGFIAQSSEGISLINELGVIVDCNKAMQEIYELDRNDIIGRYIWDFERDFLIDEKKNKERLDAIKEMQLDYIFNINTKKPVKVETEIQLDEKSKYISLTIFPIITEKANFVGRIINDITIEKQNHFELINYREKLENLVEERTSELKISEEKFRLLFEKSHDPILMIDGYRFVECNKAAVELLGYKNIDEISNVHPAALSPEYQPDGSVSYKEAQKKMDIAYSKGYHRFEWIHKTKQGKEIYLDVSLTKIPYKGRSMIFTVWRDISRQKQYEASILESEKRFSSLFEQAADGILVGIKSGHIIEANESMCKLTGYHKDELIGKKIQMLFKPEVLQDKPLRYDLVKKGATVIREREIVSKEGKIVQTEMNTKILEDGRMQALFRDITRRKKAEQALISNEQKYRNIFHSSPIGILHYDAKGYITDCNENFVHVIGSTKQQLVGLNMMNDLNNKEVMLALKESLTSGEAHYEDWYTSITAQKTTFVRILFKGIKNEQQEIISGIGLVEDITERKKAEEALKEKEQRYRMLFESANDAIFIMDNEVFIDCNDKTLEMFGCTRDEIIWKSPDKLSPEYQSDGQLSKTKGREKIAISLKGHSNTFEWVHTRCNGENFNAEVSLNSFESGGKSYLQAIVRDITERKKAEQLITDSEEKLRNIYHSSSDVIMIVNRKGKVININNTVEKYLGYTAGQFIGKSPKDFITKSESEEVDFRMNKILEGEKLPIHEVLIVSKTGEKIPVEVNSKLINYEGQKAILSVIRNIKERKELEKRIFDVMIETEENERKRLASDIHDEVGPLLSSLKMYIEMLGESDENEKEKYIKKKLKSLIKESITNVREVSKALSPSLLTEFGLSSAAKSFIKNQEEFIQINFTTNAKEERFGLKLETVYYRILKELINNTIKHAEASVIDISLEYLNQNLILKYRDDGIGIDKKKFIQHKLNGQGLTNIETRVKTIQGKFKIETEKNKGFYFELITEVT